MINPLIRAIYYHMLLRDAWSLGDLEAFNEYLRITQKYLRLRHAGKFHGTIITKDQLVEELMERYR